MRENPYLCIAMRHILLSLLLLLAALGAPAQGPAPAAPGMEFVMQLRVTLGEVFSAGETPHGRRTVVPITGGTFEGPRLRGTVLPGGADYQLGSGTRTELEAVYCIRTDDGVTIHVRNLGIAAPAYFMAAPRFETASDSPYGWLNDALFVCAPQSDPAFPGVVLNVWRVVPPQMSK